MSKRNDDQWGRSDSLTLKDDQAVLLEKLSKKYGRKITASEVKRLLSQIEHEKETGYIK